MLVYLVAKANDYQILPEKVCSWHPCATDALRNAEKEVSTGGAATVYRIKVRLRNKRDVCSLLAGKLVYDTWDTVFTCRSVEGDVVVRRHKLQ